MIRTFMLLSIAAALVTAFTLYAVSYKTRELVSANQQANENIRKLARDIKILKAERAYLMRPERIEPLARKLGMAPPEGRQFMTRSDLDKALKSR